MARPRKAGKLNKEAVEQPSPAAKRKVAKQRKKPLKPPALPKHFTFQVYCKFEMQYTFTATEVQQDPGGDQKNDFEPTEEAIEALERELEEYLSVNYPVTNVEAETDSNCLLGME